MSEANGRTSQGGSQNPWKWATIGLGGVVTAVLLVSIVKASFEKSDSAPSEVAPVSAPAVADVTEAAAQSKPASTPAAAKAAPVHVAAAAPSAPVAVGPPRPTADDVAACNSYAASARTQASDVVKKGVIGGALGAGVGAASGAIADGGKGAGKGAGIGALVGAAAGTVYGLNQKSQDDARADQAYRQCMAQRGF